MASVGTTSSSVQLLLLISTCFLLSIPRETKNSVAAAEDSPLDPLSSINSTNSTGAPTTFNSPLDPPSSINSTNSTGAPTTFNSTRAPTTPPKGHHNKTSLIAIGGAVGLVLLVVVVWLIFSYCKWPTNRHRGIENEGNQQGPTRFAYQDLVAATDNFNQEKKLGQGSFGVVYKGCLKKLGRDVAVKEILNKSTDSDFNAELIAITSVKHKNLVKLVGWCKGGSSNFIEFMCWCWKNQNNKLFLVYELVPNGNLEDHLHNKVEPLPWETRYKIVKNITSALLYLHHECDPFILHRDIKPSNTLLDENFNAKLADFGLSRIVEGNSSKVLTITGGTLDYLDPQCKKPDGKLEFGRSSDVYSFGIVLLEIACGEKGSIFLREQVWERYINRSLLQAADVKLKGRFNKSEMESVLILGLWCSYLLDSKMRPSMEQVMAVLEHGKQLPDLKSLKTS